MAWVPSGAATTTGCICIPIAQCSGLPGFDIPKTYPRYPDRAQVVDYLEQYARHFDLRPHFGAEARTARRDNGLWRVETGTGTFAAANLIVATGIADFPHQPRWPGEERFGGDIRHSSAYRNPAPYAGQKVLVVGFGNSGAEIALDLAEHGVRVALAVRGPVNIVPRDLLGIPILSIAIALSILPPGVADALSAPVVRLAIGSPERLGLQRAPRGPLATIAEQARVPLIDVGTVAKIRAGAIAIRPDVRALDAGSVDFIDGTREAFDAIIAATGFRPDLRPLLPDVNGALDAAGLPRVSGRPDRGAGALFLRLLRLPHRATAGDRDRGAAHCRSYRARRAPRELVAGIVQCAVRPLTPALSRKREREQWAPDFPLPLAGEGRGEGATSNDEAGRPPAPPPSCAPHAGGSPPCPTIRPPASTPCARSAPPR